MELLEKIKSSFIKSFGEHPDLIGRAPGRINIIGEHTDYNDGYVLPAAIDMEVVVALRKNDSQTVKAFALDMDEMQQFDTENIEIQEGWINYVAGVTSELAKAGVSISGYDLVFAGDVPLGAGMSSSAALECALATGLNQLFDGGLDQFQITKTSQLAEHNFAGVKCGIMDQFASTFGQRNQVIKLDCRSLGYEYHDLQLEDYQLLLLDTNVKHSLAESAYNDRKHECQQGVQVLQKIFEHVTHLRDATEEMLLAVKPELESVVFQRCQFIIRENQRVLDACIALDNHELEELGRLMYLSHDGLSAEYEVSCDELDYLVGLTRQNSKILGSRMMGGGFGGCTINLIHKSAIDDFVAEASDKYQAQFGKDIAVHAVVVGDGARVESSKIN